MLKRALGVIAFVAVSFGIVFATHPGATSAYVVLGFTADSKNVYFKKQMSNGPQTEEWVAVWDGVTAKPKTSQPTLRDCAGECDRGTPIDKKSGERTIGQLHKTHGAPAADSVLAAKAKADDTAAKKDIFKTGYAQVFAGKGVEVKTTAKLEGKALPDLSDGNSKTVFFQLEVAVTAGATTWTTKARVHADPVEDENNGNIILWSNLFVTSLAIAPDRHAVALTFSGKPFLIQQPKAAKK